MKHLIFIDKGKDGKNRVFTTDEKGMLLFPHRDLKIEFDQLTILDNFDVPVKKDSYGFFTGNKVDICRPESKDLVDYIYTIMDIMNKGSSMSLYRTDSFYLISCKEFNTIITQEVDSGDVLIMSESRYSPTTKSGKNPHYFAMYNAMKSLSGNCIDRSLFVAETYMMKDISLTREQKAILALRAKPGMYDDINESQYTYYDKCIVRYYKSVSAFRLYYIDKDNIVNYVYIDHDTLFSLITEGFLSMVSSEEYKNAVEECFNEGFSIINDLSFLYDSDIYKSITGTPDVNEFFGVMSNCYDTDYPVYVMNIMKYNQIRSTLTEDQIKALSEVSKNAIREINLAIKKLSRPLTRESMRKIENIITYKKAISIPS